MTSHTATAGVPKGLTFPGVMFFLLAGLNIIDGFALLQHASWFEDRFLASNADTWGWILIGIAVLQLVAGIKLVSSGGGAILAISLAGVGMLVWFMLLFTMPIIALLGCVANFSIIAAVLSAPPR